MDLCHCVQPQLAKSAENGECYCQDCGLWYDEKEWLQDPRRKARIRELEVQHHETNSLVDLICREERRRQNEKLTPLPLSKTRNVKSAAAVARKPANVFPVGSFILDEMQERGWSIEELTRRMGGNPVTQLTVELLIHAPSKGATLDEQTASLLAAAFGTSKELWLKLDETWQQNAEAHRSAPGGEVERKGNDGKTN